LIISLDCTDVMHMREMARQQLLGDREVVADSLAGRECPRMGAVAADRLLFIERLLEILA
jgi:hypothetical protein